MTRQDFRRLTALRIREANGLLRLGYASGAYHLAGYAVECALKACIARKTRASSFPPKVKVVQEMYKHNPTELLGAAGLKPKLQQDAPPGSALDGHWATVSRWSEESRYERKTLREAAELLKAITDPQNGVLAWLRQSW